MRYLILQLISIENRPIIEKKWKRLTVGNSTSDKKKLNPIRRNCNFVLCCVQFSHTCMGKNIVVWTSIQFCSLELATKSQEEFHFRSPFFQYVCIDFPRRCILVTIWTMFSRYNLDSKKKLLYFRNWIFYVFFMT